MKHIAVIACLVLLAGCEHYVDLGSKSFLPGTASPRQFAHDNETCQDKAEIERRTAGGNGDPHGIYNRTYRDCMRGLHYQAASPEGFGGWM